MILHYPYLFCALILLWLPRQWLRLGPSLLRRRKRRVHGGSLSPRRMRQADDFSVRLFEEIAKLRNYYDLLRGGLGSWCLMHYVCTVPGTAESAGNWPLKALGFKAAILAIAVTIQTLRREGGRVRLFAPIFFLLGLSAGVCGCQSALFAMILVWVFNAALPGPGTFLAVHALLLGGFMYLFQGGLSLTAMLAMGLSLLPVIFSVLSRHQLYTMTRRSVHAGSG